MNLINRQVLHKAFGSGKIVEHTDDSVGILFSSGIKKFLFPDAFGDYLELVDRSAAEAVRRYMQATKQAIESTTPAQQPEQLQKTRKKAAPAKSRPTPVHPDAHVAYRFTDHEACEVLKNWTIPQGNDVKNKSKGCPARLHRFSVCLITALACGESERERTILGAFMLKDDPKCVPTGENPIAAHPKYRMTLQNNASNCLRYWDFAAGEKRADQPEWSGGNRRYVSALRIAQILKRFAELKENTSEKEAADRFFLHFCKTNRINAQNLPAPLLKHSG